MPKRKTDDVDRKATRGRASAQSAPDSKVKLVTQSTRFTPEQMAVVEEACRVKQWSISQFLLVAAVEKAVAIKNLQENSQEITRDARFVARALFGEFPVIKYLGKEIESPDNPFAGWEEDGQLGAICIGAGPPAGPDSAIAVYDEDQRAISIHCPDEDETHPEDSDYLANPICTISPRPIPTESVGNIFEDLEALGSEMVPLIREAYNALLLRRNRVGDRAQLTNPKDLLEGQR